MGLLGLPGRRATLPRTGWGLVLLAGAVACGGAPPVVEEIVPRPSPPPALTVDVAEDAFDTLPELWGAWRRLDCAKVAYLSTWAEGQSAETVCAAIPKGHRAPARPEYSDADVYLPAAPAPEDGTWFLAIARDPEPAYFVIMLEQELWRLALGPVPALGKVAEPAGDEMPADPALTVKAKLVPQQYLTYLTDPAGVSGITFPAGDPMRALLAELLRRPTKARPDRVTTDVRLVTESPRVLMLADGGALVLHALRLVRTQKPARGRKTLKHPLYGKDDLRAFTGKSRLDTLTGSEILFLATKVTEAGKMTTIGLRRELAEITAG
ncbi:hypothetical protein [Acrocarpospora catenulata]|uniref:hypothetical protein n=1 Tax=Acrocarpospora catenulata TaxID=2836182 RepID=UPI001BDA80A2|nr:hypothetical protein [Acrocarpospora catenulata]